MFKTENIHTPGESRPEVFGKTGTKQTKNKIFSKTDKGYNMHYNKSVRSGKTSKNTDKKFWTYV